MIIISCFSIPILCFCLETLINRLFLFEIICHIPKNSSKFSFKPLLRIRFGKISCYLILGIFFVFFGFEYIRDERAPRYIKYLGIKVMKLFVILNKTPYFFIHRWSKNIKCFRNLIISKGARLLV